MLHSTLSVKPRGMNKSRHAIAFYFISLCFGRTQETLDLVRKDACGSCWRSDMLDLRVIAPYLPTPQVGAGLATIVVATVFL